MTATGIRVIADSPGRDTVCSARIIGTSVYLLLGIYGQMVICCFLSVPE
eukprot:COSAG01_NODE_63827_length_278_cov_1.536313_1_plen_48_part_10